MKDLFQLKEELKISDVCNLYIFTGSEYLVLDAYIDKIVKTSGNIRKDIDSVNSVSSNLNTHNILNNNFVYVIREDNEFKASDKSFDSFITRLKKSSHIVVLIYQSIDKRSKFYNNFESYITEFNPLSFEVIVKRVSKQFGLDKDSSVRLCNRCGEDYGKCVNVCSQINILSKVNNENINISYRKFVEEGLLPLNALDVLEDFVTVFLQQEYSHCWTLYNILKEANQSSIYILSVLYNAVRAVLLIQSCSQKNNISEKTGLQSWLINKYKDFTGIYTTQQLVKLLQIIRQADIDIKSGKTSEDISIEDMLLNSIYMKEAVY